MSMNPKATARSAMKKKVSSEKNTEVASSSAIREMTNNPAFINYVKENKLSLDSMSFEDILKAFNNYAKSIGG